MVAPPLLNLRCYTTTAHASPRTGAERINLTTAAVRLPALSLVFSPIDVPSCPIECSLPRVSPPIARRRVEGGCTARTDAVAVSLGLTHSKNSTVRPDQHGTMSKKKKDWKVEKERLLELSLEERRREYKGNHVPLEKIPAWTKPDKSKGKEGKEDGVEPKAAPVLLSDKVSLYKGDITILEVDAIVNAVVSESPELQGVKQCPHGHKDEDSGAPACSWVSLECVECLM
ncbi:O-acetyl-ADP-ribose deacetylase MACROD2-like isoform X1 [Arapaima gigas]